MSIEPVVSIVSLAWQLVLISRMFYSRKVASSSLSVNCEKFNGSSGSARECVGDMMSRCVPVTDTDIEIFHNALKFICGRQMSKINEILSEKSSEVT